MTKKKKLMMRKKTIKAMTAKQILVQKMMKAKKVKYLNQKKKNWIIGLGMI